MLNKDEEGFVPPYVKFPVYLLPLDVRPAGLAPVVQVVAILASVGPEAIVGLDAVSLAVALLVAVRKARCDPGTTRETNRTHDKINARQLAYLLIPVVCVSNCHVCTHRDGP